MFLSIWILGLKMSIVQPSRKFNIFLFLSSSESLKSFPLNHKPVALQPRGLINKSNWCYINATLQVWISSWCCFRVTPVYLLSLMSMKMNLTIVVYNMSTCKVLIIGASKSAFLPLSGVTGLSSFPQPGPVAHFHPRISKRVS